MYCRSKCRVAQNVMSVNDRILIEIFFVHKFSKVVRLKALNSTTHVRTDCCCCSKQ